MVTGERVILTPTNVSANIINLLLSEKLPSAILRVPETAPLIKKTVANSQEQNMRLGKCWDSSRKLQVDVLSGLFGTSAWLPVNALYTQLPILVQSAPEGWSLPSYLSVLIQLANIGPFLYSLSQKYFSRLISDSKLIYCILVLGSTSLLLMGFHYDTTVFVGGNYRSVVLFILSFFLALVGCTSSVLFIPFMNHYPEVYLISYMVGEGFSGLVPSIISLIQGVGGNPQCRNSTTTTGEVVVTSYYPPPLFSTQTFFTIIFSIMLSSLVSFFLLNNLASCKSQKISKPLYEKRSNTDSPVNGVSQEPEPFVLPKETPTILSERMYKLLLVLTVILSAFSNGALPSIQSYSCLPYGNVAYHFAVNLGNMANPAACFLAFFMPHTSPTWIFSLFSMAVVFIVYAFTTAVMSPHPPLQSSTLGIILNVFSWVACSGLISYVKMSIAAVFRRKGGRGLFWYGAMTQVGSSIGAVIMFYVINIADLFTSYNPCR